MMCVVLIRTLVKCMAPNYLVSEKAADARQSFEFTTQAPKLPSLMLLAMSGMTLAKWQGIFFKSSRHTPSAVRQFSGRHRLRPLESACDFLEPSPTGACRRGCEGTQSSSFIAAILLAIASPLFSSGCGVSSATPAVGKSEVTPANLEIDAGVIFSDRASYLCLPLSRFGLSSSDDIETIVSSCECVKPSLVRYSDSSTTTVDGVLFEFIPDEAFPDTAAEPMRLGVVTTFTLVGGDIETVTVNFLHTTATVDSEKKISVVVPLPACTQLCMGVGLGSLSVAATI